MVDWKDFYTCKKPKFLVIFVHPLLQICYSYTIANSRELSQFRLRIFVILTGTMNWFLRKTKNQEKVDEKTFLRNGKILLEKLITSCDGKRNPIRSFYAGELKRATNNYNGHQVIASEHYKLYKGFLENRPISVMKFGDNYSKNGENFCFNNIVFAAQMNHRNILKLIGCCLETEIPILVFEFVEYGTLADRICSPRRPHLEPLLWGNRLKIEMEIGNAMAYIHIGFHRPIVFKDIKLSQILFDEYNVAKLSDFSESEYIPEGETHVISDMLTRTKRYLAPEYILTGLCNEKTDVFCFGMLLLELLTGRRENILLEHVKKHVENNRLGEIVDPIIVEDKSCPEKEQQLQALLQLIFECANESAGDRPTMVYVAKQLRQMYLSAV